MWGYLKMREKAVFIGIDAGTTTIKASLYDQTLREIGTASRDITIYNPLTGASEIDMEEFWGNLCGILQELKASNGGLWQDIKGIGISGQGDGLWPIKADGTPVRRAMLWNDTRSKELNIEGIPGLEDLLRKECANNIYTGSMLALQKWLKVYEPESYKNIHTSLHCKDWLNYKLTGRVISEYSDVTCSSGMNMKTLAYVPEIFRLLDIEDILPAMPQTVEPADIIGTISEEASRITGLPAGVPVIAGCLDCCAVSAGTDFFSQGEGCTIIGTALINEICLGFNEINADDLRGLLLYHVVKGRYIKIMNTANGASSVDYMKNLLCPHESFKEMFAQIEKVPIGSNGLLFHPYLFGERAPFKNPFAFASLFGIRSDHSRHEIMRAAYEGVAMSFFDCYQDAPAMSTMYLSGGVSKNPVVCRMFCDVLGIPVRRQTNSELGTLGIVKMLMVNLGYADNYESLRTDSFIDYQPDMARHKKYAELYRKFVSYRDDIRSHWTQKNIY
jgi:sugar (pentulose or hexulose) kinase